MQFLFQHVKILVVQITLNWEKPMGEEGGNAYKKNRG